MKWLDSVQEAAHRRHLQQALQRRVQRQPKNLRHIKTVGILVDLTHEPLVHQGAALTYARQLQSIQKEVHILGYCDEVKLPENLQIDAFCRKERTFSLLPKYPAAVQFMATPFDVLIGLHFEANLILEYMAAVSPAHLRVGYFREECDEVYDLMVKSPLHQPAAFLERVHNYLNILNI